jgi:hypothetical protein
MAKASLIPYLISPPFKVSDCISIDKRKEGIGHRQWFEAKIPVCCVKVPSFESKFQVYFVGIVLFPERN